MTTKSKVLSIDDVNFGDEVEDIITGYKGIVMAKTVHLHSAARVAVQPKLHKEAKVPDAYDFDIVQLKILKQGKIALPDVDEVKTDLMLGDEVEDPITGWKGIAMSRIMYLNGCKRIAVQPKIDKEGKVPDAEWFPEQRLKITKAQKYKKTEAEPKQEARKPGGPVGRSVLYSKMR